MGGSPFGVEEHVPGIRGHTIEDGERSPRSSSRNCGIPLPIEDCNLQFTCHINVKRESSIESSAISMDCRRGDCSTIVKERLDFRPIISSSSDPLEVSSLTVQRRGPEVIALPRLQIQRR